MKQLLFFVSYVSSLFILCCTKPNSDYPIVELPNTHYSQDASSIITLNNQYRCMRFGPQDTLFAIPVHSNDLHMLNLTAEGIELFSRGQHEYLYRYDDVQHTIATNPVIGSVVFIGTLYLYNISTPTLTPLATFAPISSATISSSGNIYISEYPYFHRDHILVVNNLMSPIGRFGNIPKIYTDNSLRTLDCSTNIVSYTIDNSLRTCVVYKNSGIIQYYDNYGNILSEEYLPIAGIATFAEWNLQSPFTRQVPPILFIRDMQLYDDKHIAILLDYGRPILNGKYRCVMLVIDQNNALTKWANIPVADTDVPLSISHNTNTGNTAILIRSNNDYIHMITQFNLLLAGDMSADVSPNEE